MEPTTTGALITAGATLAGGLLGRDSNREASAQNAAAQREFAQHGIRWKVEDAKRAGIHPLYALGAQTHSFSPTYTGDTAMPNAIADMGQNIGRAVSATRTAPEKLEATIRLQAAKTDLEGRELDNQIKASQLRQMNSTGPSLPSTQGLGGLTGHGQGDAYVLEQPSKSTYAAPGHPSQQAGKVTDVGWAQTSTGLTPVPSIDVKERIEDQLVPELMWAGRNYLMPNLGFGDKPPLHLLPKGYKDWKWNPLKQEYQPYNYKKRSLPTWDELKSRFRHLKGG